jgi:hypothetical protein
MHGVTTALVSFLFVCVVFPNLVKNKAQYYASLVIVCCIIVLDAIGWSVASGERPTRWPAVIYGLCALLQVAAIVLLFLAAGGITWRELASDMKDAYEVLRRGEEKGEIIIPLSGEFARRQAEKYSSRENEAQTGSSEPPAT